MGALYHMLKLEEVNECADKKEKDNEDSESDSMLVALIKCPFRFSLRAGQYTYPKWK